ncbi:putative membrane protein (TIGR01666 family) [Mesocricetibacter intestinalis]|uniref:Putative membrane protein (TIGR01666 family) n=2 Tax=Mesocricetibacter intestinalis TaxID=1521930 RepID=A0A4R6VGU8_9PAST|nr:putative membrane protein (TIGR01666 family) [Mesocricetibacter intestinalis]
MLNTKIIATIPVFIAVNIAALLIWFLDISAQSMPFILGIIAGGLVDLDNRLTGRLKNIFYTLLAFSFSSLIVQYFIDQSVPFIAVMTLMTFVFTMLGAIGPRYSTIAFGTLVVALYTILTYMPGTPWYINPIMILCGTSLYSLVALIVYLFFPNRPVQESVAKSFFALADYLDAKAQFFDPDDIEQLALLQVELAMKNSALINAFNLCRIALFYRIRGQHRHSRTTRMIRYYFAAQDIHERVNSSHFDYQVLTGQLKNTDLIFRIQRLLELQAQSCRDIARSLHQNQEYHYQPRLEKAVAGITQSFEIYAQTHQQAQKNLLHLKTLLENLQAIDWQLRHLGQESTPRNQDENTERAQIYSENISGCRNILRVIRSHLMFGSQLFRHAVRLSIVVFLSCATVEFLQLDRGYWILLTAIFVCQPNYSATKLRLKQRIIGTLLGVLAAALLPYMMSTLEAKLGFVVLTSTLFFFFRTNNYSYSTFFITLQVLASFDIIGFDIYAATLPRLIDTLIGSAIAWFGVSYLWPDWKYLQLDKVTHRAVKSNAKYLLHIISQLQFGRGDNLKYRIARRRAHESATALGTAVSNMNSEPQKYQNYLQKGFELLKINYSLLSYISALGAYRQNMKQLRQNTGFLLEFYPIAKKIILLLENIEKLSAQEFEGQYLNIELSLKQCNDKAEYTEHSPFSVPIQQLNMISRILPPLYEAINAAPQNPLETDGQAA